MKMDKYIAIVSGIIGAIVSTLVDGVGLAVTVLIALMAIDYFTGLMSAVVNRELNSRIGFNGLIRKVYYLMLVGAVYLLALVVPGLEHGGVGLAIAFCALEFISITENGVKMNAWMPKYLKNLLLIVKDKVGETK